LLIEDNLDAAETMRAVLELMGHTVSVAHDGRAGLTLAKEQLPELILCDIGLPGMSGYDVARAIRADPATSGVHLVALTGYALPEDLERSSEAGFQAHLAKPPALHKLEEVIARLGADAQP
jgi:two-component system CheB/CheR fusion protein